MPLSPMMQQYHEAKRAGGRCAAAVSHGRLLRAVLRRRQDGRPHARPRAHQPRQGRRPGADGRLPVSSARLLPGEDHRGRPPRGDLRAGRRPETGQGTGAARGDADRHARHAHRRRPARPAREQFSRRDRLFNRHPQAANAARRLSLDRCLDRPIPRRRLPARIKSPINSPGSSRPSCSSATMPRCHHASGQRAKRSPAARRGPSAARRRSKRLPNTSAHIRWKASALTRMRMRRTVVALRAAGAVLNYLAETQKASLASHRPADSVFQRRAAGDRSGHAPQPGNRGHDSRRPARWLVVGRARSHRDVPGRPAVGRLAGRAAHERRRQSTRGSMRWPSLLPTPPRRTSSANRCDRFTTSSGCWPA